MHPRLPFRMREVVWAARYEMARTVEDVLARRTRALFLDARAAMEAAPAVATLLAAELKQDESWREKQLADFLRNREGLHLRMNADVHWLRRHGLAKQLTRVCAVLQTC